MVALFPNLVFYTATFALETAFIFFTLLAVAVVATHDWSKGPPSRARLVAFSVALGVSALVRRFSLVVLGGVVTALALTAGWCRAVGNAAWIAVPLIPVFTPWTVRNAIQLDAFVPFSTNLGDTACLDRSPDSTGGFRWATHDWCAPADLPEVERNRRNLRLGARFVRDHPGTELRFVGHRFLDMMSQDHSGLDETEANHRSLLFSRSTGRTLRAVADGYFLVVVLMAAPGVLLLARRWRRRPMRAVVTVATVGLLVVPLGLWGNPRFHVPLLPLFAVAAAGLGVGLRRGRESDRASGRVTFRDEPEWSATSTREATWRAE